MHHVSIPRALRGAIRADGGSNALYAQIQSTLGEIRNQTDGRLSALEETSQNLIESLNRIEAVGGFTPSGGSVVPDEPEYTLNFASYMHRGEGEGALREANASGQRQIVQAAMSVGDASSGGFLAPDEWTRQIMSAQRAVSPMRRLAAVQLVSVGAYHALWSDDQAGSGWVGETVARPETTTPGLSKLEFSSGEIYANAAATQTLLDDSLVSTDAWLIGIISREFSRQEEIAFLSGNGTNKPRGLLTFIDGGASDGHHPGGNLTVVESALTADGLIDFSYSLPSPYRAGSAWLMSSATAAVIAKLKTGEGDYVWREGLAPGAPATLLGRPVELDEGMPAPTAGNLPIAFGNFQLGYQIVDRMGVRVLRDPFTAKPYVHFYATKRVGGSLLDNQAIRLLRIPA